MKIWGSVILACLTIAPGIALATPAFVQSASGSGASSCTATFGVAVTSGNSIAIAWRNFDTTNTTSATMSDNGAPGSTWAAVDRIYDAPNTDAFGTFYAQNVTGAPTTVTVSYTGGNNGCWILAHEISGVATTGGIDGHTGQVQIHPVNGTDVVTSTAVTTTKNGDYIFGATFDAACFAIAVTPGTGYTGRLNTALNGCTQRTEDLIQGAAGSVAATFTIGSTLGDMATFVMAFPPPGGGGGGGTGGSVRSRWQRR